MRINDRDDIKDSGDDIINLTDLIVMALKSEVIFIGLLFCLRFPLIWVKIPLAIGLLFIGWRWIFRAKKSAQQAPPLRSAPANRNTDSRRDRSIIQALIAHDAAGEFGKAKTMIQQLDGKEFPEVEAKELLTIAGNYFPVALEPTANGYRFKLV